MRDSQIALGRTGERSPHFGMKRSAETKAKQRALKLGGRLTPEHRAKIGAAGSGEKHWNWKGGRRVTSDGYIALWVDESHPFFGMAARRHSDGSFAILEHRLVMAEHLGRPLTDDEVVHHRVPAEGGTGDRQDNRIENLRLFPSNAAHRVHHETLRRLARHARAGLWPLAA